MKKINPIKLGKKRLGWLAALVMVLGIGMGVGGGFLMSAGIKDVPAFNGILLIILSSVLLLLSLVVVMMGITMAWVKGALVAEDGNLVEENLVAKNTIGGGKKCERCGWPLEGAEACTNCGKESVIDIEAN